MKNLIMRFKLNEGMIFLFIILIAVVVVVATLTTAEEEEPECKGPDGEVVACEAS
jgi:hypothetical protein